MMKKLEEAIIYATIMHQGKVRALAKTPYILHPLEVAHILSTMTDDEDVICAGILHDVVEGTDGTLEEIGKRFGGRVALLVSSVSEAPHQGRTWEEVWDRRKRDLLGALRDTRDPGVRMLWLADKLAGVRLLAGAYSERGERVWDDLPQYDPETYRWYLRTIVEELELTLNKTGAFKELVRHVNSIWPGTFDSEKARYRSYREISLEGCRVIGRGARGEVFQYDDELVVKVYNEHNTYQDVEREISLSRRAFLRGLPTAIPFGIVSVGGRYGAMYELVRSQTISERIALDPSRVSDYAAVMAELAHEIHAVEVGRDDGFPRALDRIVSYIDEGVGCEDRELAGVCSRMAGMLIAANTLTHGDLHTGNVLLLDGEPLLIDMGHVAVGHPMIDISDLCYTYVVLGEDDPSVVEDYMGFSHEVARSFFRLFLTHYLRTDDQENVDRVAQGASIIAYSRLIRKIREGGESSARDRERIERCVGRIREACDRIEGWDLKTVLHGFTQKRS